jgi:fatty acid desaturase
MNEAALPVKRITDFPLEESKTLIRRPVFWVWIVVLMAVIGGVLVSYSAATHVDFPPWVVIVFLVILFFGCILMVDLQDEARKTQAENYAAYLASVSPDLLKAVASSPEYDRRSKDAVIKFLSAAHPGWSLT